MRRGPKPAKSKQAKPPVTRKRPNDEGAKVRDLEKRLAEALGQLQTRGRELGEALKREAEALEQQTATSEILRVISSSPTDIQPVLDAVAENAARVCGADDALIFRVDGDVTRRVAHHGSIPVSADVERRLTRDSVWGRSVVDRRTVHVPDIEAEAGEAFADSKPLARQSGARTHLATPLMRQGAVIGAILIRRLEVRLFTAKQMSLLQTFADQAVIAIENVRLFNETKEALEQQTATSEILGVISSSPTDVQPVLDAVAENAARLCGAEDVSILEEDGEVFRVAAYRGASRMRDFEGTPVSRGSVAGRAILDGQLVHVHDITSASETEFPISKAIALHFGHRTMLAVPLLREGATIGAIFVRQTVVRPFSDKQIALLQTFADQAVIAIENVRLFKELEARNRDLTESLDRQTATAEILRVIASSPTDLQPVFSAIAESAKRLLGAYSALITRLMGDDLHLGALTSTNPSGDEVARARFPIAVASVGIHTAAARTRAPFAVADIEADQWRPHPELLEMARARGWRSFLAVPMLRGDQVLGTIGVSRREAGAFKPEEIALLETFADQAVIAIENVRLFTELQSSNRELTAALDTQTATSDILRVISRSQTDVQPVFDAIVASVVRLLHGYYGMMTRVVDDRLERVAVTSTTGAEDPAVRASFPQPLHGESVHAKAIRDRAPVNIADPLTDPRVSDERRAIARAIGFRSLAVVPLLRYDEPLGSIAVTRRESGGFTNDEIALLQTFADQAVIAIENVRLFTELQEKNRALTQAHAQVTEALEQQTATSEILRVISTSPRDAQPVFDMIVQSAQRLLGALSAAMTRVVDDQLQLAAHTTTDAVGDEAVRSFYPQPLSGASVHARAARTLTTVNIADPETDDQLSPVSRNVARARGYRSMLVVPILRDGNAVGTLGVTRGPAGGFAADEVRMLQTFADQAVIAIENVRLFTELQEKNRALTQAHAHVSEALDQQTATSEILRVISQSPTDVQPVFEAVVRSAARLCDAFDATIFRLDTDVLRIVAHEGPIAAYPVGQGPSLARGSLLGRAVLDRQTIHVADMQAESDEYPQGSVNARRFGHRTALAVPLLRSGKAIGVIAVRRTEVRPFTDRQVELLQIFADQAAIAIENARLFKELEVANRELSAASQHKSEFLANMSHELRTPLNAIIGFSEVLSERMFGELNEKQEEYSKDIHASGQHLLSLINDILDLSKIEAGRMELELSDFHLPTALDNALTLVRERAGRRGIAVQLNVDERLGQIQADERKVRQVVLNLLSNAIKFTPEGGRIQVAAVPKDGLVEVSVSDTGVGIAPEDQEAVFEEFRQVGTAAKKVEGTGLGLTLCRKFVELHGGKIWVQSQVGAGSTFTFTFPTGK